MYNYGPLNDPITAEDKAVYKHAFPTDKHHIGDDISVFIILQIVIFNGLLLLFGLVFEFSFGFGWMGLLGIFALSVTVPVVVLIYLAYERRRSRKRRVRLYKFALANHATLARDKPADHHPGVIFGAKDESTLLETVVFPDGIEVGLMENNGTSGKMGLPGSYTYATTILSRHVPNMILDSRSNNLLSVSNLPSTFSKSNKLSLEGNFNEHFSLYVPKQYETDALYIFTPDVMDVLIKTGGKYDVEVVDNKIFLYSKLRIDLSSEADMREIMNILSLLGGELGKQSQGYKDVRQSIDLSTAHPIAVMGRRLTPAVSVFMVVITLGLLAAHIFSIGGDGSSILERTIIIIAFSWLISIIVSVTLNTYRR